MKLLQDEKALGTIENQSMSFIAKGIKRKSVPGEITYNVLADSKEVENIYTLRDEFKENYNIKSPIPNTNINQIIRVYTLKSIYLTWIFKDIAKVELTFTV
jgi:hypothetical protein